MVAHLNYTDTLCSRGVPLISTLGSFPTEITSETLTATPTQLRIVDSGRSHVAELVGTNTKCGTSLQAYILYLVFSWSFTVFVQFWRSSW